MRGCYYLPVCITPNKALPRVQRLIQQHLGIFDKVSHPNKKVALSTLLILGTA